MIIIRLNYQMSSITVGEPINRTLWHGLAQLTCSDHYNRWLEQLDRVCLHTLSPPTLKCYPENIWFKREFLCESESQSGTKVSGFEAQPLCIYESGSSLFRCISLGRRSKTLHCFWLPCLVLLLLLPKVISILEVIPSGLYDQIPRPGLLGAV